MASIDSFGELATYLNTLLPPDDNGLIEVYAVMVEDLNERAFALNVAASDILDLMPEDGTLLVYDARSGKTSIGAIDVTEEWDRLCRAYRAVTEGI